MREALLNLEYLESSVLLPPFSFMVSWLLFYPAHLSCIVKPQQLTPIDATLKMNRIHHLNCSRLLPTAACLNPQTESTITLPEVLEPFTAVCSNLPICSSLTRVPAMLVVVLARQ